MQRRENFLIYIFCSVGFHVALFLVLGLFIFLNKSTTGTDNKVEVVLIEESPDILQDKLNATRIVETDSSSANNEIDKNAKFLSEKNNRVEKETKAKSGMMFQNAKSAASPSRATIAEQRKMIFSNNYDAYAAVQKQFKKAQDSSSGQADSSSTNDHLEGVEENMITKLNSREYKYYGYYNRIKNQLNQWWVPKVQEKFSKLVRRGRTIASEESKITSLVIVLNDVGNLMKVQILSASGVSDLDDAAVEAFREAAPFPNPPRGMIDSDGTVKIRWDCVVES